eukprot:1164830-Amorphochlora_amoeboformis.AAC.1
MTETAHIVEGEAEVLHEDGSSIMIKAGDMVTFPAGISVRMIVPGVLRKRYRYFSEGEPNAFLPQSYYDTPEWERKNIP